MEQTKRHALANALRAIAAALVDIESLGKPTEEQIQAVVDAADIIDQ